MFGQIINGSDRVTLRDVIFVFVCWTQTVKIFIRGC